ncbi:MAG: hypothetical protein AAF828_06690 [Bacteroidota bacterium]
MKIEEREIWYNQPMIEFVEQVCEVKVMQASRGAGKTRMIPEDILDRAEALPRARQFLASYQYDMIWNNNLPDIYEVFALHGLVEGEDFVVNRQPPKHFVQPRKKLIDPSKSLSLFNGFCLQFIAVAMDAKKHRGKSYDGGIIDEGLLFKESVVDGILIPTLRGINWWKSPYWKMLSIYSSAPATPEGEWFLKYKQLAKEHPHKFYFSEATAYDNAPVLGENYVERQRMIMNPIDFQREILNRTELKNIPDQYYYEFDELKHCYHTSNRNDDVIPTMAMSLTFDFGGRYSCCTASQQHFADHTEYILDEFDTNTLTEQQRYLAVVKKLRDIVNDFIVAYADHPTKYVTIKGDATGQYANVTDTMNLYEQIEVQLIAAGWIVSIEVEQGTNPQHKTRYFFMNRAFKEDTPSYPSIRINAARCPNLVSALKRTRVTDEYKKDKKEERNEHANQSLAPHLTDTVDYLVYDRYIDVVSLGNAAGMIDSGID